MKRLASLALALSLLGFCPQARASYDIVVPESSGLFSLRVLEEGEYSKVWNVTAQDNVSAEQVAGVRYALAYWGGLLAPEAVTSGPIPIQLLAANGSSFALGYVFVPASMDGLSLLGAALTLEDFEQRLQKPGSIPEVSSGLDAHDRDFTAAGISMSTADWYLSPMEVLPENGNAVHLSATIAHELVHSLGLLGDVRQSEKGNFFFYSGNFGLWSMGLRDMYGKPARPGMEIAMDGKADADRFVTANRYLYMGIYFTGEHVREVLGEGTRIDYPETSLGNPNLEPVPGVPVNGVEAGANTPLIADYSHIELQNGLLSHQFWRNWGTLMEAELAVVQDMGLKFDRRQLFGFSIYSSGTKEERDEYVNANPYYARENGQWIVGRPSEMAVGVGLHIYGSYNDVIQKAELLSIGDEAVGIRVDGVANKIVVPEGTRVQADGRGGSALLVSYGNGHVINLAGEATSLGEGALPRAWTLATTYSATRTNTRAPGYLTTPAWIIPRRHRRT